MKRTVPVFIAVASGLLFVVTFVLDRKLSLFGFLTVEQLDVRILDWVTIVGGFTLILGAVSILRVNMRAFQQGKKDRIYKLVTIASVLAMGLPGIFPPAGSKFGLWFYSHMPDWAPVYLSQNGLIVNWLFDTLDAPMMSTMFATLAFYIASAAYRAFRARSIDATLLLLAALLVMLWRVPMGEAILLGISPDLPELINTVLMRGVNASVQRAIIIGAALGAAAMSLRIILGIEKIYLGKS